MSKKMIMLYVDKDVSAEQKDWAHRERAKGNKVNFSLNPKANVKFIPNVNADEFVSDNEEVIAGYKEIGKKRMKVKGKQDSKDEPVKEPEQKSAREPTPEPISKEPKPEIDAA